MSEVRELEPKAVWNHFEDLNAVPRPSKKEERVIEFAKNFGESLGLSTYVDEVGNVIIKKPATAGMEDRQTVIIQSHLDMVCQKNADTDFDFDTQGIQSWIDGDWVKAKGTTLGADNGMGVAAIMTILKSDDIPHPAIEALFTVDEETGMTGAFGLETGILEGSILLNLDTEDDDEFSIGCAGGVDTNTYLKYKEVAAPEGTAYKISLTGLKGGHSGMDINLGRGNANKLMNRVLWNNDVAIHSIDGGSLRNAIPRESFAVVIAGNDFKADFDKRTAEIIEEFKTIEPDLSFELEEVEKPSTVMDKETQDKMCMALFAVHNGVYRMSPDIEGLVESSSSFARVKVADGRFVTQSLQRSSVESTKWDVASTVGNVFRLIGARVDHEGSYPGWKPNADSKILASMKGIYEDMFNEKPHVAACHAGLECGILGERYPGLDMISFGPTIRNPHSPDEKVNIASVQKFWNFLVKVLAETPLK